MGQFKYNLKMESSEPSVVLKLKKGGHVNKKAAAKAPAKAPRKSKGR